MSDQRPCPRGNDQSTREGLFVAPFDAEEASARSWGHVGGHVGGPRESASTSDGDACPRDTRPFHSIPYETTASHECSHLERYEMGPDGPERDGPTEHRCVDGPERGRVEVLGPPSLRPGHCVLVGNSGSLYVVQRNGTLRHWSGTGIRTGGWFAGART